MYYPILETLSYILDNSADEIPSTSVMGAAPRDDQIHHGYKDTSRNHERGHPSLRPVALQLTLKAGSRSAETLAISGRNLW